MLTSDTLRALVSAVFTAADSLQLSGQLHLLNSPTPPRPGWFERWGVPALVNVAAVALLGWFVQWRLQRSGLGQQALLALFTQRSGLLSEAQLRAAQETWTALSDTQARFESLVSPLQRVVVRPADLADFDAMKDALRAQEDAEGRQLLNDNAVLFAVVQRHKPFLPKSLFDRVAAYTAKLTEVSAFLDERREFIDSLPSVPLNDRPAAAHQARQYGTKREEHVLGLRRLSEEVEEEIRRLTTPDHPVIASTRRRAT